MRSPAEPAARRLSDQQASHLERALDIAREQASDAVLALFLSGSHASGEAVWSTVDTQRVCLSDLDLYALYPNTSAAKRAEQRIRDGRAVARRALEALGFVAPLEIACFTARGLDRMIPRPASIELARHGVLVAGDACWQRRLPAHGAADIPRREIDLLMENRAFELLHVAASAGSDDRLDRLRRRHATLKVAVDLAGVLCLSDGTYPDGSEARIERARGLARLPGDIEPPWTEALAWRRGGAELPGVVVEREEWLRTARAWSSVWRSLASLALDESPVPRLLEMAGRARMRRRVRRALIHRGRAGYGRPVARNLWYTRVGAPEDRLHASAAALLLHFADPSFESRACAAMLRRLGVVPLAPGPAAARSLVRIWDRWELDGERTVEWS